LTGVGNTVGVVVRVGVAVRSAVTVTTGVAVVVGTGVVVAVSVGTGVFVVVGLAVPVAVGSGVEVSVGSGVIVGTGVTVAVRVAVGVTVSVAVGTGVVVAVAVRVAVGIGVVAVGETVAVAVAVAVTVGVADGVGVAVVVGVGVANPPGPVTTTQLENSDVFPSGSVAVAVMNSPTGTADVTNTLKLASQPLSVVTLVAPMKRFPSPKPEGSHSELAKNSMVKAVFGWLLRVPVICMLWPSLPADVSDGKFCRLFGPVSESHASLGVRPQTPQSSPRSMPGCP